MPWATRHVAVLGHRTCITCGRAGHVARRIICLTDAAPRRAALCAADASPLEEEASTTQLSNMCTRAHGWSAQITQLQRGSSPCKRSSTCESQTSHAVAGADTRAGVLVGCRARRRRACAWRRGSRGWVGCGRPSAVLAVKRAYSGWGKAGGLFNVHEPTTRGTSRRRFSRPVAVSTRVVRIIPSVNRASRFAQSTERI
jgi:hypothetical protein